MPRTLLVAILLIAAANSAVACEARLGRGWSTPTGGTGSVTVARDEGPCGAALWTDPDARLRADSISVTEPPQHGVVTVEGNTFRYTPARGYAGPDRFALTATGPGRHGGRAEIHGTVQVTVGP
jgi:hypothetical protein